ncbi:MAG TPA: hypothetical protein VFJ76_06580 [Solirubrobacterales bacterium]|nr:hypothetical protein [Solirubrobacterales bacterium]
MAKYFGFVQFDFAGSMPLADGRYLAGEPESGEEAVLVLQRLGAPPLGERRRRRGRPPTAEPEPSPLALTRVTVIRAATPFEAQADAARWLDEACEAEDTVEALAAEAAATLNRALHAQAVAAADPYGRQLAPEQAERVLLGYGSGEETADGRFTDARQVDLAPRAGSRRRRREDELRPQERVAAVLRGREQLDACETLLLRARADLDAGRDREAALQLRVGLEALLVELDGAVDDPGHEQDMAILREHRAAEPPAPIEETLSIAERVLRRRRVLHG